LHLCERKKDVSDTRYKKAPTKKKPLLDQLGKDSKSERKKNGGGKKGTDGKWQKEIHRQRTKRGEHGEATIKLGRGKRGAGPQRPAKSHAH